MKVKDLILELNKFDHDTRVCLSGYEGGVYNPTKVLEVVVALDVNDEWYYGPHEEIVEGFTYSEYVQQRALKETMVKIY